MKNNEPRLYDTIVIGKTIKHYKKGTRELHFDGGPAYYDDTYQAYYQDGVRHRLNGPARIWLDGSKEEEYWIEGIQYTKTEFEKKTATPYEFKVDDAVFEPVFGFGIVTEISDCVNVYFFKFFNNLLYSKIGQYINTKNDFKVNKSIVLQRVSINDQNSFIDAFKSCARFDEK